MYGTYALHRNYFVYINVQTFCARGVTFSHYVLMSKTDASFIFCA